MKLKHVPDKQEMIKHGFKIEKDYSDLIESYSDYVKEMTGTEILTEEIVPSMLKTFLDDDKKFHSWIKSRQKLEGKTVDNSSNPIHSPSFLEEV